VWAPGATIAEPADAALAVRSFLGEPTPRQLELGLRPLLPLGARVLRVAGEGEGELRVTLELPRGGAGLSQDRAERALSVLGQWAELSGVNGLRVDVRTGGGRLVPLTGTRLAPPGGLRPPHTQRLPAGLRLAVDYDPASRLPYGGALEGRTLVVSPGHGWIWDDDMGRYRTQRGLLRFEGCGSCRGVVEDFSNAEIVQRHLLPLLEGAGARVVVVRERDLALQEWILDDQDPLYSEEGGAFTDGTSAGGWRDSYRVLPPGEPGSARWDLQPPEAGLYQVSVRFRAGGNRTGEAVYRVVCAGGSTEYIVDQRSSDQRWIYLGEHTCAPDSGHFVELRHGPDAAGHLIADAVRVGGGVDSSAGQPRWQMAAHHYLPYLGAPAAVVGQNDVVIRPAYANWIGADAYVSVHTNAFNGSHSGFSTYRYNCGTFPDWSRAPGADRCDQPHGSAALHEAVHAAVLQRLRADWDPGFRDGGLRVANFGELRPLDGMPGVLLELAFHDNLRRLEGVRMADNQAIQDPRWRRAAAWGILRGLVDALADPDQALPPPSPQGLVCVPEPDAGTIRVAWEPVEGALGYVVQVATGEPGFGPGTLVEDTEHELGAVQRGVAHMVRVRAAGPGGLGPPSEVGAAALADPARPRYRASLLVEGFDRWDAWVQAQDNTRSYLTQHALALAAAGPLPFGSAANEALDHPWLAALDPGAVVWAAGEESTEHLTLSPQEQAWLEAFAGRGGAIWLSGSEVVWALDEEGTEEDRGFLERVLGVRLRADDAEVYALQPLGVAPFDDLPLEPIAFDDGTHGTYDVDWPDVLTPAAPAATEVLAYPGQPGAAAVAWQGPGHRSLVLGVPLETVISPEARAALLGAGLRWLLPPPEDPLPPGEDLGPPGADAGSPGRDAGAVGVDAGVWDASSPSADDGGAPPADAGTGPADIGTPVDAEGPSPDGGVLDGSALPDATTVGDVGAGAPDLLAPMADARPDGAPSPDSGADRLEVVTPSATVVTVPGMPGERGESEAGCLCSGATTGRRVRPLARWLQPWLRLALRARPAGRR